MNTHKGRAWLPLVSPLYYGFILFIMVFPLLLLFWGHTQQCSEITPGGARGTYGMPKIKPGLALNKASSLPAVLVLWFLSFSFLTTPTSQLQRYYLGQPHGGAASQDTLYLVISLRQF